MHDQPWSRNIVLTVGFIGGLAGIGLISGAVGTGVVSDRGLQERWFALGAVSVLLAEYAVAVWLTMGMLRVARLRQQVVRRLNTRHVASERRISPDAPPPGLFVVVGSRTRLYHRAGCKLLSGRPVEVFGWPAGATSTASACGICGAAADERR